MIIIAFDCYAQTKNDVDGFLGIKWDSTIETVDETLEKKGFVYTKDYMIGYSGPFEHSGKFAGYPAIVELYFEYTPNMTSLFNKAVVYLEPPRGLLKDSYERIISDLQIVYGRPEYSIREHNETYKDIEEAILYDELKYETMWEFEKKNKVVCYLSRYNKYYFKIAIMYMKGTNNILNNLDERRLSDY